jgi:hypothetical protein
MRDWHGERACWNQVERDLAVAAKDALIDWLNGWPWEWYVTLTFRGEPTVGQAMRAWGDLMAELRARGGDPRYFRGLEWQQRRVPHFHALVYGVDFAARRMDIVDWWWGHYGIARILAYDPNRGARHYVGKYLVKDAGGWGDWQIHLGPCQRGLDFRG